MKTLAPSLLTQIAATNAGDPWYGFSRAVLLEGITAGGGGRTPDSR
ncbi:MAG: hypothetical protein IPJ11_15145 [Gemmatimonadetes bacterium]|nr:hypothetical protein [Gemmatimonadota bacterium]